MDLLSRQKLRRKAASIGGKASGPKYRKGGAKPKGLAANPKLASELGKIGGAISRRKKNG